MHDDDRYEQDDNAPMDSIDMKLQAMELRQQAEARYELMAAIAEDNEQLAKAFYSAYSSLVEAGFSEDQAMQLIIARGWHLAEEA